MNQKSECDAATYILVSMDDNSRELTLDEFPTKKEAWETMRDALIEVNNGEFKEDYEKNQDENGYVEESTDYGIGEDSAWANADDSDLNCDWKIFRRPTCRFCY